MTVVTTRPDATDTTGTVTGAASAHAALSDDSDSSYVTGYNIVRFVEPTIPAGAIFRYYTPRARVAHTGSSDILYLAFRSGIYPTGNLAVFFGTTVTWGTPTTVVCSPSEFTHFGTPITDLRMSVEESGGLRVYELFIDTTYVVKPVTNVTAPTGTVTDTNTPTVQWSNTLDSDGGAQTTRETRIFSSAQYGAGGFAPGTSTATAESGVVADSATSWACPTALANATYRAYTRVAQTVDGTTFWSDWDYEGFVVNVTPPNAPSITLTAEDDDGRIKVDLDDASSGPSTDLFEIEKSDDGGTTWKAMRLLTEDERVTPSGGLATVYDYEAANGVATYYRARALHNYSGQYAASSWAPANASWSSTDWWIKSPTKPSLNLAVVVYGLGSITKTPRQGVFKIPGRRLPVIAEDVVRDGPTGTITLGLDTVEEREALDELLDSCDTLLLQGRAADYWTDRYVRFGQQDSARMVDKSYVEATFETLPWTEVEAPSGVVEAWPP